MLQCATILRKLQFPKPKFQINFKSQIQISKTRDVCSLPDWMVIGACLDCGVCFLEFSFLIPKAFDCRFVNKNKSITCLPTLLSIHELFSTRAAHFVVYERNDLHQENIAILREHRFVAKL